MRSILPRRSSLWPVLLALLIGAGASPGAAAARSARATLTAAMRAGIVNSGGADGVLVRDLTTGQTLYSYAPSRPRLPASVEKLYTTSTALLRMGPAASLGTQIRGVGKIGADGTWRGTLYLRGGGDPTFGSASYDHYAYGTGATVEGLVADLHQQGITRVGGRIVGDESIFDSDRGTVATGNALSTDVEGELSGLAYDRGFADIAGDAFQAQPALFAAQGLANALRAGGIKVLRGTRVSRGRTPADASVLATVRSPTLATLANLTNTPSDNYLAEMLLKGLGARFGGAGTSAAGAAVVRAEIAASFGIHPRLDDGSGLSRDDRTSPLDVVTALTVLAGNRPFVRSLAIGGETGTIRHGLAGTPAQGRCRGKTGSLSDVANLAGYCTARDGHQLVFAFLMNGLGDPGYGHTLEYRMAVALARYNG